MDWCDYVFLVCGLGDGEINKRERRMRDRLWWRW